MRLTDGAVPAIPAAPREPPVLDLVFILVAVALFGVTAAYVSACERM